jgi:hypothetical protein
MVWGGTASNPSPIKPAAKIAAPAIPPIHFLLWVVRMIHTSQNATVKGRY